MKLTNLEVIQKKNKVAKPINLAAVATAVTPEEQEALNALRACHRANFHHGNAPQNRAPTALGMRTFSVGTARFTDICNNIVTNARPLKQPWGTPSVRPIQRLESPLWTPQWMKFKLSSAI
jgi:hypothetical protein